LKTSPATSGAPRAPPSPDTYTDHSWRTLALQRAAVKSRADVEGWRWHPCGSSRPAPSPSGCRHSEGAGTLPRRPKVSGCHCPTLSHPRWAWVGPVNGHCATLPGTTAGLSHKVGPPTSAATGLGAGAACVAAPCSRATLLALRLCQHVSAVLCFETSLDQLFSRVGRLRRTAIHPLPPPSTRHATAEPRRLGRHLWQTRPDHGRFGASPREKDPDGRCRQWAQRCAFRLQAAHPKTGRCAMHVSGYESRRMDLSAAPP